MSVFDPKPYEAFQFLLNFNSLSCSLAGRTILNSKLKHSGNSPPETMGHVGTTLFATFASGHTLNSEIPGSKRIATNGYHFIRHGQAFLGEAGTTTLRTNDEMPSIVMGAVPLVC